jgi:hypothetical protein
MEYTYANKNIIHEKEAIVPGQTKIHDYINQVRQNQVAALRAAQKDNLDAYELEKHKYAIDRTAMNAEKLEELKANLFANKFAFLLEINQFDGNKTNKCLYKMYTIVLDFYLSESDLSILK